MPAKARTIVLFPEPFGPLISKPPTFGLIALIKMASLSLSKPTIAEKGKTSLFLCIYISGLFYSSKKQVLTY